MDGQTEMQASEGQTQKEGIWNGKHDREKETEMAKRTDRQADRLTDRPRMWNGDAVSVTWLSFTPFSALLWTVFHHVCSKSWGWKLSFHFLCIWRPNSTSSLPHQTIPRGYKDVPDWFVNRLKLSQCHYCSQWFLKLGQHLSQCKKKQSVHPKSQSESYCTLNLNLNQQQTWHQDQRMLTPWWTLKRMLTPWWTLKRLRPVNFLQKLVRLQVAFPLHLLSSPAVQCLYVSLRHGALSSFVAGWDF